MKSTPIRWIIGLMGLAMTGLIVLQFYWINNLITANKERFTKDVLEALNNVANKLERQETIAAYKKFNSLNRTQFAKEESAIPPKWPPQRSNFDVVRKGNQAHFVINDTILNGQFEFAINFSSEYFYPGGIYDFPVDNSLEEELEEKDVQIQELETQVDRISRRYETTLDIMRDIMNPRRDLHSRFHPKQLDSLLDYELTNKGINIPYHYGVVASHQKQFVLTSNMNTVENLKTSHLKANLFPNDVLGPSGLLMIDFPDEQNFLFRKIWAALVSSGILAFIILFCFGYSIRTILRQKKLSEMKNDFINNMTHELKTPISTVSLAVEALNDRDIQKTSLLDRYLNVIHDENKRLGEQVEKVLQIAAIDKKDYNLKYELLRMNEMVKSATDHITMQVESRGGRINVIDNASEDVVKADEMHMTNVILNLLENANKYSPDAPNITIRTESDDKEYRVCIQDRGIGMSKEQQKLIFEKFYRVPTGNLHNVKGFGLGLSYVNSMVQAHEGRVEVESEPGKGSKFYITLPLANEA